MHALDLDTDVRRRIDALGGFVLTHRRLDPGDAVRLRCAADHVWETTVEHVVSGAYCPRCARYRHGIATMQALAEERGGQCLSTVYRGTLAKLSWRCKRGHEWLATPNTIFGKCWCPSCGLGTWTIEEMHTLAASRRGRCLSKDYRNKDSNLLWQCAVGHRWEARPGHVKRGSWCPHCAGTVALSIATFRELAQQRGGECLSTRCKNSSSTLRFRCATGHEWTTAASNVRAGHWCPQCAGTAKGLLAGMRSVAKARGGMCSSKRYINASTKLWWRCAEGHEWNAVPSHVVRGSWCPRCASSWPGTIADMRRIAAERGGRCSSTRYVKSRVPLEWKCAKGHRFEATPAAVLAGRWCRVCSTTERAAKRRLAGRR